MKKIISLVLIAAMAAAIALSAFIFVSAKLAGDVNNDGEANNKDVVELFRYVSGDKKLDDESAYDFNGDNEVNNKDVVELFRFLSTGEQKETQDESEKETETEPEGSETETEETVTEPEGSETEPEESETAPLETVTETEESTEESESESESESGSESETEEPIPAGAVQIGNREELFDFASNVLAGSVDYSGKTIVLTADIDLDPKLEGGNNWTPLPTTVLAGTTINGRGHTIKNMTITPDDLVVKGVGDKIYGSGFIAISTTSLTIKNLVFKNANITSTSKHVGCVIGSAEVSGSQVKIDNVSVIDCDVLGGLGVVGDISTISMRVGGIIGANTEGGGCNVDVTNCKVEGTTIQGFHNISGIVGCTSQIGDVRNTNIDNCTVKNVILKYSARYLSNYTEYDEASRYFADLFYSVNDHWSEYHTDIDVNNHGNTYENIEIYDMYSGDVYNNEEGKSADFEGKFPVSTNVTRPVEQRPQ